MGGVDRQCWTSSPQRTWGGWCHRWKRRTPGVRCQSGSSGSAGSRRRRGRNPRCFFPPPHSSHRRARSRRRIALFFLLSPLSISLDASTFSWDRPGRRAKGCLQRAATVRTVDRKTGQNVRRHDLPRSNASMIKQKKNMRRCCQGFVLEVLQCSPPTSLHHSKDQVGMEEDGVTSL